MGARVRSLLRQAFALLLSTGASLAFEITGALGGINPGSGTLPSRFEISSFSQSGPAWDLFILSLYEIQRSNQSDPLSYFQIAGNECSSDSDSGQRADICSSTGVHGYPQAPYDGVQGTCTYPGYCMHAATPFSTWHRPYLALYEVTWP